MTTGRINQVALLRDAASPNAPRHRRRRGRETGTAIVLDERETLEPGTRWGAGPHNGFAFRIRNHERSSVGRLGGAPRERNTSGAAPSRPSPERGLRERGREEAPRSPCSVCKPG